MRILRTPESRFTDLKDYPFRPHFTATNNIQLHYVDEGHSNERTIMLLHGVPTWSYLYRHIIKRLAESGNRVIAPDLIGFGKSDKPDNINFHSYQTHIDSVYNLIITLKLKDIILFGHDWGSLIGLRIAAEHPDLFSGIIISNGMLPTGEQKLPLMFKLWKGFAKYSAFLPVDCVIGSATIRKLSKEEKRAYRAPFPSSKYKCGIRALPGLVPSSPYDKESIANFSAWESLGKWEKPFLTIFSNSDPITRGGDKYLQSRIPGAAGQEHVRLDAKHFIQEDHGTELTDIINRFSKRTACGFGQ